MSATPSQVWRLLDDGRSVAEITFTTGLSVPCVEAYAAVRPLADWIGTYDRSAVLPEGTPPPIAIPPAPDRLARFAPEMLALLRRALPYIVDPQPFTLSDDITALLARIDRRTRTP